MARTSRIRSYGFLRKEGFVHAASSKARVSAELHRGRVAFNFFQPKSQKASLHAAFGFRQPAGSTGMVAASTSVAEHVIKSTVSRPSEGGKNVGKRIGVSRGYDPAWSRLPTDHHAALRDRSAGKLSRTAEYFQAVSRFRGSASAGPCLRAYLVHPVSSSSSVLRSCKGRHGGTPQTHGRAHTVHPIVTALLQSFNIIRVLIKVVPQQGPRLT